MNLGKMLKAVILKFDLFKTTEYFRYNEEPQYRTFTGGCCSIAIIVIFVSIFSTAVLNTLDKQNLTWQYGLVQQISSQFSITTGTSSSSKFMFAIGVSDLDLSLSPRYFDFFLTQESFINGTIFSNNIPLTPCQRIDWEGSGKSVLKTFDRLNFSRLLCPPANHQFNIAGFRTSQIIKYINIRVSECDNSTFACVPTSTLEDYLMNHSNFELKIFFINSLINPSSPKEVNHYLQDRNYVPFNFLYGGQTNLYMSPYTITTDEQILPFEDKRVSQGGVVNYLGQYIASRKFGKDFASINFKKSSLTINIERQYTKIDTTLSYIGGLFGFLIIFFLFMNVYTEFAYEIDMGDRLYKYERNNKLESQKFNFLVFIGYLIYELLVQVGCKIEWKLMKKYSECREEINEQFDISFLMKRVIFLERSLKVILEDHQFKGLHMHQKLTLKEAEELRSFYQIGDKMEDICIEEVPDTEQIEKNGSKKSSSDNSAVMNMTENIFENSYEGVPEQSLKIGLQSKIGNNNTKGRVAKRTMVQSKMNSSPLESEMAAQASSRVGAKSEINKKIDGNLHSNFKLLHKHSQNGDKISKKIYEGFNTDIVKRILLQIQQEKEEQKQEQNEIVVNQNEDEFQIRISKTGKTINIVPRREEQKIQTQFLPSSISSRKSHQPEARNIQNKNQISNQFEYIK